MVLLDRSPNDNSTVSLPYKGLEKAFYGNFSTRTYSHGILDVSVSYADCEQLNLTSEGLTRNLVQQ